MIKGLWDHIKLDDLYTQVATGLILVLVGWFTGLFDALWRSASGALKRHVRIKRDTTVGGWYSYVPQKEIEYAVGRPNYNVSIFIKTRWWVTNYSTRPILISEAYFVAERPDSLGRRKHNCQGLGQISKTGELLPTTIIDKAQHIEVDTMLFTDSLDNELAIVGFFVLVDQAGKEYRTETLKHYQRSAEPLRRGWRLRRRN
jgi:hypothetical protein